MTSTTYTRPVRRSFVTDTAGDEPTFEQQEHHAPYFHQDCASCEQALLETIDEGNWENTELLSALNEAYFGQPDWDSFSVYRHFHPLYSFNYSPYESSLIPIALPGKQLVTELRTGDLVIMRSILSNRTHQAVVTDPRLRSHEELGTGNVQKPGAYVQVYGNIWANGNGTGYVRVQDSHNRTPDDTIIVRKLAGNDMESEQGEALAESPAEVKEFNLKYVQFGKGGGYMYAGDKSINYNQILQENNLGDFETRTARHFLETEGGIDSINTYDNQVVSWGFGFAGKSGNMIIALHLLLSANAEANDDFHAFGISLASEKKKDLSITADEKTYTGDDALQFWKLSKKYLNILIQLTQKYAKDAFLAQWKTFKRIHGRVFTAFADPLYLANISDETERNKAKVAVLHAHHHYPAFNPPDSFRNASSFEEVLNIYVNQSSKYGSVQGNANSWRRSINKIFSGNVAPTPTPTPPSPKPSQEVHTPLHGSVGRGGQNATDDVLKVQALLNGAGIPIPVNGQMQDNEGDLTILAIYRYQGKRKLRSYDGRIDPNGATIKALMADAKLPVSAESGAQLQDASIEDSYTEWTNDESMQGDMQAEVIESEDRAEDALDFQWMFMKPAHHPGGHERLYYVTSGSKDADDSCYFPFKIRNKLENSFWQTQPFASFLINVYAQVQLTRTEGKKQVKWKQKLKDGEKETIWKKLLLASTIPPEKEIKFGKGVELNQEMLHKARAVDNEDLSARMDIEIYYTNQEYFSKHEYNKKKSLLFYLVRPIEYVFGSHLRSKPDKKRERQLIIDLRRKLLAVPTKIKSNVSITISKTETNANSKTISIQTSTEKTSGSELKVTIPFSKLLDGLGVEATLSREVKEAIAHTYSSEQSFSSEEGDSVNYSLELPAAPGRGKYRQIYIEPKLKAVPIDKAYHYTDINDFGMAGRIEEIDIPFIYKIDGWHINIDEFGND